MKGNANRKRGKRVEKKIAKLLGGERIGILGGTDVVIPGFSIEVKSRKKFAPLKWLEQARNNCRPGDRPMVRVHITGTSYDNDIIMMDQEHFLIELEKTLSYIAGFFDGEGCISGDDSKNSYCVIHLSITNTNEKPLQLVKTLFGGNIYTRVHKKKRKDGTPYKTTYKYRISGTGALSIVKVLIPYLIVKRAQALEVMRMAYTMRGNQGNRLTLDEIEIRKEVAKRLTELNGYSKRTLPPKKQEK